MMYVKSNHYALHTLKLYKAVYQWYLSQTGREKKQYGKSLWVLIWVLVTAQMGNLYFLHTISPTVTGKAIFLTKIQAFLL